MKIKLVLSMLVILVAIVAAVGGTLAWFTDRAEIDQNVFTAGTVLIDATDSWAADQSLKVDKWNPGDCDDKEVDLEIIGNKSTLVRMKITETWTLKYKIDPSTGLVERGSDGNPIEIDDPEEEIFTERDAPYVTWKGDDLGDFIKKADEDGVHWWYYDGVLGEGQKINILTEVCFYEYDENEDKLIPGNKYQGAVYTIDIEFEAIQASNNASGSAWGENSWYFGLDENDVNEPQDPETEGLDLSGTNWADWGFNQE